MNPTREPLDVLYCMKREMIRRRLSHASIKTYVQCVRQFMRWYSGDLRCVKKKDITGYLYTLSDKGVSGNTMNVHFCALKFVLEQILNKRWNVYVVYSKKPQRQAIFLEGDELRSLFSGITNEKHLLLVKLMFGAGLRVSELVSLKVQDLEIEYGYGHVRNGKGKKDRLFIIPLDLKDGLKGIVEGKDKGMYLFSGQRGGHYSTASVRAIAKCALRASGLLKHVTPHTLRHSFATHVIKNGNSLFVSQSLLGHKSPETTMGYVHMASPKMIDVKSPLDDLYGG